jgi:hypothetical protein
MYTRQHIFAALLLCWALVPIPVNAQESGYFQVLYDTTHPRGDGLSNRHGLRRVCELRWRAHAA